jgi:predicted acetyltransferase
LVSPTVRVEASYREAVAEFLAENPTRWPYDNAVEDFAAYVDKLHADALEETPRAEDWVPSSTFWYVDGGDYLGRLSMRHRLTPQLLEFGGHIGYDVRPTARRRGYATAMLRDALPHASALGIDQALLTCDVANVASRKVIESAGGVLEDERAGKLRFWVPTSPSP